MKPKLKTKKGVYSLARFWKDAYKAEGRARIEETSALLDEIDKLNDELSKVQREYAEKLSVKTGDPFEWESIRKHRFDVWGEGPVFHPADRRLYEAVGIECGYTETATALSLVLGGKE